MPTQAGIAAGAVAPPVTPKVSTSVDPLYTQAVAQAKAALAAETAPVQSEQAASDAQFQQRQTDATGVAAALSKLLQPIGPAVNGEYQTAAQNQELAANGFSQGMQDALKGNTDNLNAMLSRLNSPAQLDSHASQAGDVLYGLGGFNPGTTFSKQGAAFGAAADLQAGDAILKGQENVKSLQAQAIVADKGFQNKIAEMAGKLPGDVQTNYDHLQTIALNDAKFRESVRKDNIDQAYKQANLKLSEAKYSTSIGEFNAKQKLAYDKLAQQQFNSNRDYQIKLANLGIAQARLQQTIMQNSLKAANGGLSKAAVTKYTSVAQAIAMKSYYGVTKVTTVGGVPKSTANVGNVTYSEALQNILQKGVPVQIALDALDRVYPQDQRPTDAILAQVLGPLDPAALKAAAAEQAQAAQDTASAKAALPSSFNPQGGVAGGFVPTPFKVAVGRADQGRDIQTSPGAPIIAPGAGYVVRIASDPGGGGAHFGPSYPIVHFTSGPYAGQTVYIGHTVAAVQPGQKFGAGAVLSHTGHGGPESGGAPPGWAEIGFAPGGTPGSMGQQPPF